MISDLQSQGCCLTVQRISALPGNSNSCAAIVSKRCVRRSRSMCKRKNILILAETRCLSRGCLDRYSYQLPLEESTNLPRNPHILSTRNCILHPRPRLLGQWLCELPSDCGQICEKTSTSAEWHENPDHIWSDCNSNHCGLRRLHWC